MGVRVPWDGGWVGCGSVCKMVCWAGGNADGVPWTSSAGLPVVSIPCNLLICFF